MLTLFPCVPGRPTLLARRRSLKKKIKKKKCLCFVCVPRPCTAVDRLRQVQQRVRLLRGQRLLGRRPSVHILRGAHQRRLPGAQRLRVPGQRARRRENSPGRLPFRPVVLAPPSSAPDALAARLVRVLHHARPVSRRRQALGFRAHLQHGSEYVYTHGARQLLSSVFSGYSRSSNNQVCQPVRKALIKP